MRASPQMALLLLGCAALGMQQSGCGGDDSASATPDDGDAGDAATPDGSRADTGAKDAATDSAKTPCIDAGPVAQWSYVDGAMPGGITYAGGAAENPNLVVFNGKLYLAWAEAAPPDGGASAPYRVHVAVYSGNDASPSWAHVDAGLVFSGGGSNGDYEPRMAVANGKLYLAAYNSSASATVAHVSVYGGNDASPAWTSVDGATLPEAEEPDLVAFQGSLYEIAAVPVVGNAFVRVAHYDDNDVSPAWQVVDGNGPHGLDYGLGTRGVVLNGNLYAFWLYNSSGEYSLKAASYGGGPFDPDAGADAGANWTDVTGSAGRINDDVFHFGWIGSAAVANGKLYAEWSTPTSVVEKRRVSVYNGNDSAPAWISVDNGGLPGGSARPGPSTGASAIGALDTTLFATFIQNGSVEVASFNGDTMAPAWKNELGCRTELNFGPNPENVAYLPQLASVSGKLYVAWQEARSGIPVAYAIRVAVRTP